MVVNVIFMSNFSENVIFAPSFNTENVIRC